MVDRLDPCLSGLIEVALRHLLFLRLLRIFTNFILEGLIFQVFGSGGIFGWLDGNSVLHLTDFFAFRELSELVEVHHELAKSLVGNSYGEKGEDIFDFVLETLWISVVSRMAKRANKANGFIDLHTS